MADDIVKEALEAFRVAQDTEDDNRKRAKDDIEFARLRKQWPDQIRTQRELENRPCLTIDKLGPVIRQVVNDARMNRPATSIHPVDGGADKETAEVLTGLVRNIEASSDADIAYDTAVENAVSGGFGYWRINTEYAMNAFDEDGFTALGASVFDQNIFIRPVPNPFSVYGDPYSQAADSSDWNQAHVVEQLTRKAFEERYKGAAIIDFSAAEWADIHEPWLTDETVQIAEYWKREKIEKKALQVQLPDMPDAPGDVIVMFEDALKNDPTLLQMGAQVIGQPRPVASYKVVQYMVSGAEELSKLEWAGCYIPIVPVYGDEVNLEGKRYFFSLINCAKDSAQKYNFWSTSATEMVALAPRVPYIGRKGAFKTDADKWATANSASHAFIEYDGEDAPKRADFSQVPAGMLQEALTASDEIKATTGIYDASLGARSNETSGVAIRNRQMEGDVATYHFIDNLTRAIRHSGRIIVDLIPKVYSTPRIVRIMGEDGTTDEKPVNQEFEDKGAIRIHDVRTGRYDVVVKAGPSFTTRREEAAQRMMEWAQALGPDNARLFADLIAKAQDWLYADEIARRAEKMLPPEVREDEGQVPPEMQAQLQQMGEALQAMQAALAQAQDEKDIKRREIAVDEYQAVTARVKEMGALLPPEVVQALMMGLAQDVAATEAVMPVTPQAAPFGQAA